MGKHTNNTSQYLLRMAPDTKRRLQGKADQAGVPLSEAFRVGAETYLDQLIGGEPEGPDIANDLRTLASRVENRFGR